MTGIATGTLARFDFLFFLYYNAIMTSTPTGTIPAAMEPIMPSEGAASAELEDMAVELIRTNAALEARVPPRLKAETARLVRSMNCYYSNLIEGHNTHPRDIERAMAADYAAEPEKRNLQLEARAHIEVQGMIDDGSAPAPAASRRFILWTHAEFCQRLPPELLKVTAPDGRALTVMPGAWRDDEVDVGTHAAPDALSIDRLISRFEAAYNPNLHSAARKVIAAAAAHHRLLWIHPFLDGNGRVARLFSHAALLSARAGCPLWSVSRGLARKNSVYKEKLQAADTRRQGNLDGRGTLSEMALVAFCRFFLDVCLDQVSYMAETLDLEKLVVRMRRQVEIATVEGRLPEGSFNVLRGLLTEGDLHRTEAGQLSGFKERKARDVVHELLARGYLVSDGEREPVRLGFPAEALPDWFPRLYPDTE